MDPLPQVDDLRLVLAVGRTASIGSAARELRIAQPSASQRLRRLERLVGVQLFERDTRGARPTLAGAELIAQARHILGHLDTVYEATRAAGCAGRLVLGTFPSLARALFPVLEQQLSGVLVDQRIDHGEQLIDWVAEGSMDAAYVAIADQLTLPRGTTARVVGHDELVLFVPSGVPEPRAPYRKAPFKGQQVVFATYDRGSDGLRSRLTALGADPRRAITLGTAVAMARLSGQRALVPRIAVARWLLPGERVLSAPFRYRLTLSMITGSRPDRALVDAFPRLRRELGLTAPRRRP